MKGGSKTVAVGTHIPSATRCFLAHRDLKLFWNKRIGNVKKKRRISCGFSCAWTNISSPSIVVRFRCITEKYSIITCIEKRLLSIININIITRFPNNSPIDVEKINFYHLQVPTTYQYLCTIMYVCML